ncbi:universal stress protein [Marinigracilibium pacificum]|uniref:Universal stress protein n=1 Tax=Marinigracilibium pacificum TaxID=2729599 RepID=A0A848J6Y0_9BACT|nr:universal stress protein [Marinigracilibium pacificum]NMM50149.1 universal stress protein [Marinigracilibium pacificum]
MKILIPIDLTEAAKPSLKAAAEIATRIGNCEIMIIHGTNAPFPMMDVANTFDRSIIDEYLSESKTKYEELISEVPEIQDLKIEFNPDLEFALEAILDNIKTYKPDLIILGNPLKYKDKNPILGNTITDVLHTVTLPLLIIPEEQKDFNFKEIVFSYDFKQIKQNKNISVFNEIRKAFDARVHVLYAGKDLEHPSEKEIEAGLVFEDIIKESPHIYHFIPSASFLPTLEDYLEEHNINMVVNLHREKSFWQNLLGRSKSHYLATHIRKPLLILNQDKD